MPLIRLDPHVHLYDCYSIRDWVAAAIRNLRPEPGICAGVIVVDRAGQDSFARLRREVPQFGEWEDLPDSGSASPSAALGKLVYGGQSLFIIPGVQYVTAERLEVLGLGVKRTIDDGHNSEQTVRQIQLSGGIACFPWSPGKWCGARGKVVENLRARYRPGEVVFGDISMRSGFGPPSRVLSRARRDRFSILPGSDPLPRVSDVVLVGSYGVEFSTSLAPDQPGWLSAGLGVLQNACEEVRVWGRPNGALTALKRFATAALRLSS